jgi:hypothetical protein
MRFWIREILGWLLVLIGLAAFYLSVTLLLDSRPWIFEAGQLTVVGFVVFRGGIHLLKVAVAARVCAQSQAHPDGDRMQAPLATRPDRVPNRPAAARRA